MTIHRIDFGWKVGDRIRPKRGGWDLTILGFDEDGNAYGTTRSGPRHSDIMNHTVDDPCNWQFACHHPEAPFTTKVIDTVKVEENGFKSGFYYGLKDQFYQAGGPGCVKLHTCKQDCRHMQDYDRISALENKLWRAAWRAGQEKARMKKPVDFSKPLRLGDPDVAYPNRKVHYVGKIQHTPTSAALHYVNLSISDKDPPEWQMGREFAVDEFGLPLSGGPAACWIENVPEQIVTYHPVGHVDGFPNTGLTFYKLEQVWSSRPRTTQALRVTREGDKLIAVEVLCRS